MATVITLVAPPEGPIDEDGPVIVEITNPTDAFVLIIVIAEFDTPESSEVAWDNDDWGPEYDDATPPNEKNAITDGFQFVIQRNTGWLSDPRLRFVTVDVLGNLVEQRFQFSFSRPAPALAPTSSTLQFTSELSAEAVDFGIDISTFPDLDASLVASNDPRLLGEAILRRFITPRGTLWAHPNYGTDLRQYLNETITDDVLQRLKADAELEAEQDERVETAEATVDFASDTRTITLRVSVTTAEGPFVFTITVDQLTATLSGVEEG